jgi:hypothetical protein
LTTLFPSGPAPKKNPTPPKKTAKKPTAHPQELLIPSSDPKTITDQIRAHAKYTNNTPRTGVLGTRHPQNPRHTRRHTAAASIPPIPPSQENFHRPSSACAQDMATSSRAWPTSPRTNTPPGTAPAPYIPPKHPSTCCYPAPSTTHSGQNYAMNSNYTATADSNWKPSCTPRLEPKPCPPSSLLPRSRPPNGQTQS